MIIFLNGCSSSGKTTIAKAIQHLSDEPWLLLGIDTFFHMMPSKYVGFGALLHK
jgi:chloramphenicol 3-O phosphotransferase